MEIDFSIIITCYNESKFIIQAIDSVLAQTALAHIKEIIVVDDGSKDNSKEVVLAKAAECGIVKYVYRENGGLPMARNTGIENVTANYLAFLDGDDIWLPQKLERQIECIKKFPQAGLIYSDFFFVDSNDISKRRKVKARSYTTRDTDTLAKYFVFDAPVIPSTVCIPKKVLKEVGVFDPQLKMGEDTELWLRIAAKFPFQHIPEGLLLKRMVFNSLGSNTELNTVYYDLTTDKITQLYPQLEKFVPKRNARRRAKLGMYYEKKQDMALARREYIRAITLDAGFWKPYFFLMLSFFPNNLKEGMVQSLKKIMHR